MYRLIPYEETHRDGVIAAVQEVHREYGFTWDADGYHRDLYEIEEQYLEAGGMFWSLLHDQAVVGCVGVTFHDSRRPAHDPQGFGPIEQNPSLHYAELHRLYLVKSHRRQGWGRRMLDYAIDHSRKSGCTRMIAWSDYVLKEAHALYLQNGFIQCGQRICNDPDQSREIGLWKEPL